MIRKPSTNRKRARAAFTLLEILVVVAIIAALGAVAVIYLLPQQDTANRKLAQSEIRTIENACKMFQTDNGVFPDTLQQLLIRDQDTGFGPYLKDEQSIIDPWGQIYAYQPQSMDPQGVERPLISCQSPKGLGIANYQAGN